MRMLSIITVAFYATIGSLMSADAQQRNTFSPQGEEINNAPDEAASAEHQSDLLMQFTDFPVNTHRYDPYKRINFRVVWDGQPISGVTHVSPISRRTQVVKHRSGSDPANSRSAPGLTTIQPITLRRGVTHDTAFEAWANLVWNPEGQSAMSLKNYRKNITIDLLNLSGTVVKRYMLHRCWPTLYVPLAVLDADTDLVAEEVLMIQCESWERDKGTMEPAEN